MKVAIIDLGSNAVRMFIAKIDGKDISVIERFRDNVRLSENMSESMFLQDEPVERTLKALKEFKTKIDEYKVDKVVAVATAAVRTAKNSEVIVKPLKEMGINLEIIDGMREANYDYLGVVNTMNIKDCVIIDIGGASTEIILVKDRKNMNMISIPFGAVSLKEKYIIDNDAIDCTKNAEKYAASVLDTVDFLKDAKGFDIVALGGSARALGQIDTNSEQAVNGYELSEKRVIEIIDYVNSLTLEQIKNNITIEKKRADIIKGGFVLLRCLINHINSKKVIVSRSGVREGILYELAD